MVESRKIDEESFADFSEVVDDLIHEIGNSMMIVGGYADIYERNLESKNDADVDLDELKEFLNTAKSVVDYAGIVSSIPEEDVRDLMEYAESHSQELDEALDNDLGAHVERIAKVSRDTMFYQRKLEGRDTNESIVVGDFLAPLESAYQRMRDESVSESSNYGGLEDQEIGADYGLGMITWTLGKNWEDHALDTADVEFGFNVEETDCFYEIDVWDTGTGLYDEFSGEGKNSELRYREASELFKKNNGAESGHGLPMAQDVAELYGVDIFYSEEMLEDEGFGVKIKIPKY
jgi:hypothetical protein